MRFDWVSINFNIESGSLGIISRNCGLSERIDEGDGFVNDLLNVIGVIRCNCFRLRLATKLKDLEKKKKG